MIINRDYAHFTKEGLKFLMDKFTKIIIIFLINLVAGDGFEPPTSRL